MPALSSSRITLNLIRLRRLLRRPLRQQWLVVEAFVTLWTVKAIVRALPFDRWRRILQRPLHSTRPLPPVERVAEVVWAVDKVSQQAANLLTCLPRSVAVRSMMARRGWPCQLEIGVALDAQGHFEAHAWIEYEGRIIIGAVPNMERFAKLPPLLAASREQSSSKRPP